MNKFTLFSQLLLSPDFCSNALYFKRSEYQMGAGIFLGNLSCVRD